MDQGEWRSPVPPSTFSDLGRPYDMTSTENGVNVLFARQRANSTEVAVVGIGPSGSTTETADLPQSRVELADSDDGSPILAVLEEDSAETRYLLKYEAGSWAPASPDLEGGPGPNGGAAVVGDVAIMGVTDTGRPNWAFSAFESAAGEPWQLAPSGMLGRGQGFSQGHVGFDGTAIWQKYRFRNDPLLAGRIEAARRDPVTGGYEPFVLWTGESIGPGSLDTAVVGDSEYFLYLRGVGDKLRATVRSMALSP